MANKKKEYYKPGPMTEGKRNIIQGLLQEYNIESAADIQEALKDLLGGTIKEMMEAEMDEHFQQVYDSFIQHQRILLIWFCLFQHTHCKAFTPVKQDISQMMSYFSISS